MNPAAAQYEAARQPLTTLLDDAPAASWTNASPCDGWAARDVVRHVVETQREFLTGHGVDLGRASDVDADPAAAWRAHAEQVATAISDDAVPATAFDGYFGPTTIGATLQQFYVFDMVVHRWDVARSVGRDTDFSSAELDQIEAGMDSFGEGLYMDGICKPGVEAPVDGGRQARLLARLGRRV